MGAFFTRYFCEGQSLDQKQQLVQTDPNATWFEKNRKVVGIGIPVVFFWAIWWTYMAKKDLFGLFNEATDSIPRYYMSITMVFGSMIAGATSEGGASVAFPVMTLGFRIKPPVARDFSFMIQSFGMSAAAFTILFMKVKIEKSALTWVSLGGAIGIIFGLEVVAPALAPAYAKMYFVTIWFTFAVSLFWLNRLHGRKVYDEIQDYNHKTTATLFAFGVLGGIFSSVAGSGIDICSFACLTLMYRVSEKTATPTSVVLMAMNTCVGFMWRALYMDGVEPDAWGYLAVCIPIVVIGAPLGSMVGSHFHRLVLAWCVYITDTVQMIGALIIVKPWQYAEKKNEDPAFLTGSCVVLLILGGIVWTVMARQGEKIIKAWEEAHPHGDEEVAAPSQDANQTPVEKSKGNDQDGELLDAVGAALELNTFKQESGTADEEAPEVVRQRSHMKKASE